MAAATLLRSVARKLARAPPPPPPHPLARGLRDGARSGAAGSLPSPTSEQIQQGMRDRSVVGMAGATTAAGLRSGSGAGLPSLAGKVARAPPHGHLHRFRLHERGLHSSTSPNPGASGSTPPPPPATNSDNDIIKNLRFRLRFAIALAGAAGTVAVYLYFWELPEAKAQAYSRGKSSFLTELAAVAKEIEDAIEDIEANKGEVTEACIKNVRANVEVTKAFIKDNQAAIIKDVVQANVEATEASTKDRQAVTAELNAALEPVLSEGEQKE